MAFKNIKKTLGSLVLAASIALTPVAAKAKTEKEYMKNTPNHIQWVMNNKDSSRAMVLGANLVFNCLKAGIGSYVNDKGFFVGCAKGTLAGAVSYLGEWTATYNEYPMVGAAGKLINDLGVSMSDNVMRGEGMFSQYQTELGPLTITFRDSVVPHPSFTLTPAVGIVASLAGGQKFDARQSLYNLTPIFTMPLLRNDLGVNTYTGGYTTGNVISYTPVEGATRMILSHEFNHALFWSRMRFCGDMINWVPTEKLPLLPEMEKIQGLWNIGQDICDNVLFSPMYFDKRAYYYEMPEVEAYIMQRK